MNILFLIQVLVISAIYALIGRFDCENLYCGGNGGKLNLPSMILAYKVIILSYSYH